MIHETPTQASRANQTSVQRFGPFLLPPSPHYFTSIFVGLVVNFLTFLRL